jgi:Holliday junction resolvase RusA-like endonuclease
LVVRELLGISPSHTGAPPVTACPLCGGEPDAPVAARWAFELPVEPPSQNRSVRSVYQKQHYYRRTRDEYEFLVRSAMKRNGIPEATGKRRIRVTRLMGKGKRAYDHANLVGGCKGLIDACVRAGLLKDDTAHYFEGYYRQERDPDGKGGALLVVEELS